MPGLTTYYNWVKYTVHSVLLQFCLHTKHTQRWICRKQMKLEGGFQVRTTVSLVLKASTTQKLVLVDYCGFIIICS